LKLAVWPSILLSVLHNTRYPKFAMGSAQGSEEKCCPQGSGEAVSSGAERKPKEPRKGGDEPDSHEFATKMQGKMAVSGRYHHMPKTLEEDYEVATAVLGSGFNGSVYKAYRKGSKGTGESFAVKEFKLRGITAEKKKEFQQECEIFLSMDHPHVARLVDVYEDQVRVTLVMECMNGGELFDRVISRKRFDEKDAVIAAHQMLLAVNYLHSHGIVHRDIKLENWLYESSDSDHLKLIDFGFSKAWDPNIPMHMSCGTLSYVAPEVLNKKYTSQCDMWSLGVVIFILLAGYMPFSGADEKQVRCIKEGKFTFKEEKWATISKSARDFVEKLMKVDASSRLTCLQALDHPWIESRTQVASRSTIINEETVNNMISFAQESKFRRSCMLAMAWSLSNEERAKLRSAFLAMDTTHSGTITVGEFKNCVEEHFQLADEQVQQIFHAIDAANNNEIQYSEFLAAMVASRINLYDDFLETAFRRFDTDSSGFISFENLKTVLGDSVTDTDLKEMMREVDANNDGKISKQEFTDYIHSPNSTQTTNNQAKLLDHFIDSEVQRGDVADEGKTPMTQISTRKEAKLKTGSFVQKVAM